MDDEPQGQMFPILHWNGDSDFNERFANEFMGKTLHSDMTFYVELDDALIPGHALIVSAASPMLDQFLSDHVDLASRIIKVANCPLKDFNVMLRYIYSGKKTRVIKSLKSNSFFFLISLNINAPRHCPKPYH